MRQRAVCFHRDDGGVDSEDSCAISTARVRYLFADRTRKIHWKMPPKRTKRKARDASKRASAESDDEHIPPPKTKRVRARKRATVALKQNQTEDEVTGQSVESSVVPSGVDSFVDSPQEGTCPHVILIFMYE